MRTGHREAENAAVFRSHVRHCVPAICFPATGSSLSALRDLCVGASSDARLMTGACADASAARSRVADVRITRTSVVRFPRGHLAVTRAHA